MPDSGYIYICMCVCFDWQVAEELQSGPMSTEEKELLHLLTSPHLKVKHLSISISMSPCILVIDITGICHQTVNSSLKVVSDSYIRQTAFCASQQLNISTVISARLLSVPSGRSIGAWHCGPEELWPCFATPARWLWGRAGGRVCEDCQAGEEQGAFSELRHMDENEKSLQEGWIKEEGIGSQTSALFV